MNWPRGQSATHTNETLLKRVLPILRLHFPKNHLLGSFCNVDNVYRVWSQSQNERVCASLRSMLQAPTRSGRQISLTLACSTSVLMALPMNPSPGAGRE